MPQTLGIATIQAGQTGLDSAPGATLDLGGVTRKVIKSGRRIDYCDEVKEAMIECEVPLRPGMSLDTFRRMTAETVIFRADTGQRYVINGAFLSDPPTLKDGDGGNVKLKFVGQPAEEVV